MALAEGQVIDEVWSLVRRLGAGTFGEVWLARHTELGHDMALKIPTDPYFVRQLRTEGKLQFNLRHPNIVVTHDLKTRSNPPFVVMEFVDGRSLRQILEERGKLPVEQALGLLKQMLEAVAYAHGRGVLHRDLKPENILVAADGTVKVTDFGLGKVQEEVTRSLLRSGSISTADGDPVSGTIAYMSPEQQDGAVSTSSDDVYALGVVGCEMLLGKRPGLTGVSKLLGKLGVTPELVRFLEQACEERSERYSDAGTMRGAMQEALALLRPKPARPPEAVSARPLRRVVHQEPQVAPPSVGAAKRDRVLGCSILGGLGLLAALILGVFLWFWADAERAGGELVESSTSAAPSSPSLSPSRAVAPNCPAPPAGPEVATVSVESEPSGATVIFDGSKEGKTPRIIEGVRFGAHKLKLIHEGFRVFETDIRIAAFGKHPVAVKLEEILATLEVDSTPPNAHVSLNNEWKGQTPVEIGGLQNGTYTVTIWKDGYAQATRKVEIRDKRDAKLEFFLNALEATARTPRAAEE